MNIIRKIIVWFSKLFQRTPGQYKIQGQQKLSRPERRRLWRHSWPKFRDL